VPEPDGNGFCPPTAQHAIRQGKTIAQNIVARIRGGEQRTFDSKGWVSSARSGHHSAVAEIMGINISGFLAWWMWRDHLSDEIPGWGRV